MELRDYRDMYDKMNMSEQMDERVRNAVLNQQERKVYTMKKHNYKKTAVAAALCGIILIGGVSAYAASGHLSLLSLFANESSDVKNSAVHLLQTEISQEKASNDKQAALATFDITEAICDKNQVIVQVEVKATDNEKYLLIPQDCEPELDHVSFLDIRGIDIDNKLTVAEYAKSLGKTCLKASASVDCEAGSESIANSMEADGTMIYTIHFQNVEKQNKLHYICDTAVYPVEGDNNNMVKDKIKFTLTDKSKVEVLKYLPVSNTKIAGTDLVVDEITFEKSDLTITCNVKYHYTGNEKDWMYTSKNGGICFYMLDKNGDTIWSNEGNGVEFDGNTAIQNDSYSLQDLPDTITFDARNIYESDGNGKISYGTFEVKLMK